MLYYYRQEVSLQTAYGGAGNFLVLAHRGGAGEAPENTLEGFRQAAEHGCDYFETDVRADETGELYLHHNATSLWPNRPLKVDQDNPPPTLGALFTTFPNHYFAIDPKHKRAVEPLAQAIVKHNMEERVCIGSSFDKRAQRVAERVQELSPENTMPATALVGVGSILKLLLAAKNIPVTFSNPAARYIHVPTRFVTRQTVEAAHRYELEIIAWTVNDETTMQRLAAIGVDGFMTDYPSLARDWGNSL